MKDEHGPLGQILERYGGGGDGDTCMTALIDEEIAQKKAAKKNIKKKLTAKHAGGALA